MRFNKMPNENACFDKSSCVIKVARKQHICKNCGCIISANEKYAVAEVANSKKIATLHFCHDCFSNDVFMPNAEFTAHVHDVLKAIYKK